MDELAELSGRLLIAQLAQMTLLIAIAWLALKLIGNNRPHLTHVICLVVLAKCLLPPVWGSTAGVLPRLAGLVGDTLGIGDQGRIDSIRPFDRDPQAEIAGIAVPAGSGNATADEFAALARSLENESLVESSTTTGDSIVARIAFWWLVSALVMGVLSLLRVQRLLRSLRRSRLEASPELEKSFKQLHERLRIRRCVRLLVTSRRVGPAVIGLYRPLLVLPEAIVRDAAPGDIEPILAHELLHVRRGDLWVGLLQMLAEILWWFHPLVKALNRALSREAERCCDEEVVAELGYPPARYARCLLNVLERKQKLAPVPAFPGVRAIDLTKQRLERIMELGNGSRKRTPWWCWLVALALAALVLPGREGTGAEETPGRPGTSRSTSSDRAITPARPANNPIVPEQPTGTLLFGASVNSDAGVTGSIVFEAPVDGPGPATLPATARQPAAPAMAEGPLDKQISVNYRRTPLVDALGKLAREAGSELMLDVDALKEEGLTKHMAINFSPEQPVTIRAALKLILTPLNLTFVHEQIVEENQTKSSRLRVTTLKKFRDEMVLKTYPVADLVVPVAAAGHTGSGVVAYDYPVPMRFTGPPSADASGVRVPSANDSYTGAYGPPVTGTPVGSSGPHYAVSSTARTNHEALLELIRTSIEPDSWGKENQGERIEFYPQTLSLVVRHRRGVHEQIANLLSSLRNEQGIQIWIECILFSAPHTLPEECCKVLEQACTDTAEGKSLSEKSMQNLRAMIDAVDDIEIFSRPKLTTLDNRGASLHLGSAVDPASKHPNNQLFSLLMLPSVSEDRRQVRFKLAINARDTYDAISRLRTVTVDSNAGALLDVTEEMLRHGRTPGVDEVTRRLQAIERETRTHRTYLMLVPTIHIEEEEEEHLGIDRDAADNLDR